MVPFTFKTQPISHTILSIDYVLPANPTDLTFAAGSAVTGSAATSTSQCLSVSVVNDILIEPDESFSLSLSGAAGRIAVEDGQPGSQTMITIHDSDVGKRKWK